MKPFNFRLFFISEIHSKDLLEDYRAKEISNRIQDLPAQNCRQFNLAIKIKAKAIIFFASVDARDEDLLLSKDYDDEDDLSNPDRTIMRNTGIGQDCDFFTSDLCIDVDRYPR